VSELDSDKEGAIGETALKERERLGRRLLDAAHGGLPKDVERLLAQGADPSWTDDNRQTPLHLAARRGDVKILEVLLPVSDVGARMSTENTPLMLAVRTRRIDAARLLLPASDAKAVNESGLDALMMAALGGCPKCVALMLPVADAANRDVRGMTALMWAARSLEAKNKEEVIELLLPASDPLAADNEGETALMWAVEMHNVAAMEALLPVSDLAAVDRAGRNALAFAKEAENDDFVEVLAKAMAESERRQLADSIGGAQETDAQGQRREEKGAKVARRKPRSL
jgi:ankyrin repeat protein